MVGYPQMDQLPEFSMIWNFEYQKYLDLQVPKEEDRRRLKKTEEDGRRRKKTEEDGRRWKKTEEDGRRQKKSEEDGEQSRKKK